jgi:hypothetical protein
MTGEFGRTLYWTITSIAALIVMWDIANFFYGLSRGEPILHIVTLIVALVIWLIACACRLLLAEH